MGLQIWHSPKAGSFHHLSWSSVIPEGDEWMLRLCSPFFGVTAAGNPVQWCLEGLSEPLLVWALLNLLSSHLLATLFLLSLFCSAKTASEVGWATKMLLLALECTGRSTLYTWKGKSLIASNLLFPYTGWEITSKSFQLSQCRWRLSVLSCLLSLDFCTVTKTTFTLDKNHCCSRKRTSWWGRGIVQKGSITTSARITSCNSSTQEFHKINEELPPSNFHP